MAFNDDGCTDIEGTMGSDGLRFDVTPGASLQVRLSMGSEADGVIMVEAVVAQMNSNPFEYRRRLLDANSLIRIYTKSRKSKGYL